MQPSCRNEMNFTNLVVPVSHLFTSIFRIKAGLFFKKMRVPSSEVPEVAAYMKQLGIPDVLETLLTKVLQERPNSRSGLLECLLGEVRAMRAKVSMSDSLVTPLLLDVGTPLHDKPEAAGGVHHPVYRVCFTGGPCAGKTTSLSVVRERLEQEGFTVLCTPEAATMLFTAGAGIAFEDPTEERVFQFQLALLNMQLCVEAQLCDVARSCGRPAVVLCDRGAMDGRAFCSDDTWGRITRACGRSTEELRDAQYDLVVHLVTAAQGAEDCYTTENNEARTESPADARAQDERLLEVWFGHPNRSIIHNTSSIFADKVSRTCDAILHLVGVRRANANQLYSLSWAPEIHEQCSVMYIKTRVLRSCGPESTRLCTQWNNNGVTYVMQTHTTAPSGVVTRTARVIGEAVAASLLEAASGMLPTWDVVRRVFTSGDRRFEVLEHDDGRVHVLAEVRDNVPHDTDVSFLPPFLFVTCPVSTTEDLLHDVPKASREPHRVARLVSIVSESCSIRGSVDMDIFSPCIARYRNGSFRHA